VSETEPKTVTILGSTGSVGRSTVDLLMAAPERFRVLALVGNRNAALLAEQALALRAEVAVCADPAMRALDHGGDHRPCRAGADSGGGRGRAYRGAGQ
jgi:1-deoxy-D-xylulose 5-phosphate reductoisomerase